MKKKLIWNCPTVEILFPNEISGKRLAVNKEAVGSKSVPVPGTCGWAMVRWGGVCDPQNITRTAHINDYQGRNNKRPAFYPSPSSAIYHVVKARSQPGRVPLELPQLDTRYFSYFPESGPS